MKNPVIMPDAGSSTVSGNVLQKKDSFEIITFRLLQEEFAFRITELEEILRRQRITRVPGAPAYVMGITSMRGKIIPVMDLKQKLSLPHNSSEYERAGKILIVKGPKGPVGAAVDKVIGVVRLTAAEMLPPPSHLTETGCRFIDGVVVVQKRFVSILNMEESLRIEISGELSRQNI